MKALYMRLRCGKTAREFIRPPDRRAAGIAALPPPGLCGIYKEGARRTSTLAKRRVRDADVLVRVQEVPQAVPGNPHLSGIRGEEKEVPQVREQGRCPGPRGLLRQDL